LIIAIISAIGILLIIAGFIKSRKQIWIGGLVLVFFSFLIGMGLLINQLRRVSKTYSYHYNTPEAEIKPDHVPYERDSVIRPEIKKCDASEVLSDYVENSEHERVLVDVYIGNDISKKGLHLSRISRPVTNFDKDLFNTISLSIYFSKKFSGLLELTSWHCDESVLSISKIFVQCTKDEDIDLDFVFNDHFIIDKTEYYTLSIGEPVDL